MSVVFSLLSLAVPIGLVVLIVMAFRRRGAASAPGTEARGVRRFFQYLLLFALIVVAAIGLSDLLARAFGAERGDYGGGSGLAQSLAFVLVGVPLVALLAWWTRRAHRDDPTEGSSVMYAVYVTLATLTGLAVAMVGLADVLAMAFQAKDFDGGGPATLLVWGGVWAFHWWLARRTLDPIRSAPHLLLGSLIGLGTALVGFVAVLASALEMLLFTETVFGASGRLGGAAAIFVTGALVWMWYWVRSASRAPHSALWFAYVLPIGVGGGLLTAIVAASVVLWQLLVWLLGDPSGPTAAQHFESTPTAAAAAIGGALVWWYHRAVLSGAQAGRTELRRVYEYLVAAIGLVAAASGVGMVLVAAIESFTPGLDLGMSVVNTLLGALTLLLVGVPVWWAFWSGIRRAVAADAPEEIVSPTRRIYLMLLFGLAGVAAVISLIVVVFVLLQDVIEGRVSGETFRAMRYGLGVLVATAAVSAYHGAVYRQDRQIALPERPAGPRSVVLVGQSSPELVRLVEHETGAHADLWTRVDGAAAPWSGDAVLAVLAGHPDEDLLVISERDVLRIVVVDPSGQPPRTVTGDIPSPGPAGGTPWQSS